MTTVNQVDIGVLPNDAGGDPLRVAFAKINDNFNYLSSLAPEGPEGAIQYIKDGLSAGDANLVYNQSTGVLDININAVPLVDNILNLGSDTNRFAHLYLGNSGVTVGNVTINESGNVLSFPVVGGLVPENASLNVNNLTTDGDVTINGNLLVGRLETGSVETTTYNNNDHQVVFEIPLVQFDTGVFEITSRSMTNRDAQKVTLEVGRATGLPFVKYVAYGTIFAGDALTRYHADVAYGNVRVMVNPIPNTQIHHAVSFSINT